MFEISINTNILVFGFYGYIENIGEISMNILTKIPIRKKWFKIKYLEKLKKKMIK